jgi:hypothetical protein
MKAADRDPHVLLGRVIDAATNLAHLALRKRDEEIEKGRRLAQYIIDHTHAGKGLGDEPHGQWNRMQAMAYGLLNGSDAAKDEA